MGIGGSPISTALCQVISELYFRAVESLLEFN
jgi:hypothetical protein